MDLIDICISSDGSFSAFNKMANESYHNLKDGALNETLYKHILPSLAHFGIFSFDNIELFEICKDLDSKSKPTKPSIKATQNPNTTKDIQKSKNPSAKRLCVLDICFGLGYNSFGLLATLMALGFRGEVIIYAPEKDNSLFPKLRKWPYPRFFTRYIFAFEYILQSLQDKEPKIIIDEPFKATIQIHKGEAIDFIQTLPQYSLDIVYQDAFSPPKNPTLWSEAYFALLHTKLRKNGIITTYSLAKCVRENAKKVGFIVYHYESGKVRKSSLMSRKPLYLKHAQCV